MRDVDENLHPIESHYDLDSGIDALRLAVDAERYAHEATRAKQLAAEWKRVAASLADALRISGWTQVSGGQQALDSYTELLRKELAEKNAYDSVDS